MATSSAKTWAENLRGMRAAEIIGLVGGLIVIFGFFSPWVRYNPEDIGGISLTGFQNGFSALSVVPELILIYIAGITGSILALWGMFENRRAIPISGSLCGIIVLAVTITVSIRLNSFDFNGRYIFSDTGYGALLCMIGGVWLLIGGWIGLKGVEDKTSILQGKSEKGSAKGWIIGVIGGLIVVFAMALPWFSMTLFDPDSSASVTGVSSGFDEATYKAEIYLALTFGIFGIFLSILGGFIKRQIQGLTLICGVAIVLIGSNDINSNISIFSNQPGVGVMGVDVGVIVFIVGAIIMLIGGIVSMKGHRAPDQPASTTPSTTS